MATQEQNPPVARETKQEKPLSEMSPDEFAERFENDWKKRCLQYAQGMLGNEDDAEEAVKDVLVGANNSRRNFEGRSTVLTWLITITRRECFKIWNKRSRKRCRETSLDNLTETIGYDPADGNAVDPSARIEASEIRGAFSEALMDLPEDHQKVFVLRFWYGITFEAIAALLGRPASTLRGWVREGKEKLKQNPRLLAIYLLLAPPAARAEYVNDEKTEPNDDKEPRT